MKLVLRVFAVLLALAAAIWFASSLEVESEAASATPAATTSEFEGAAPIVELVNEDPAATPIVADREPTRAPTPSATLFEPPALSKEQLARLDLRVVSRENGAGVPNHRVTAFVASADLTWEGRPAAGSIAMPGESARTDEAGRATLYVAPHSEHIVASLDMFEEEYRRRAPRLEALQSAELQFAAPSEPDIVFRGRVVAAAGGAPISGARVRIVEHPASALSTDAFGAFELRGHSWTDKRIRVEAEPYLPFTTPLVSGHETADRAFEFRLSRAAALEVQVLSHDGRPTQATVIVARPRDAGAPSTSNTLSSNEWTRSSSSAGRATFESLPADVPLDVRVRSQRGPTSEARVVLLDADVPTSFEWRLKPTGAIRGRLVDTKGIAVALQSVDLHSVNAGEDVSTGGARVDSDASTLSNSDGAFEFRDVPLGLWRVAPASRRSFDQERSVAGGYVEVELDAQHLVHEIELRLEAGDYIRGSVLSSQGKPARTLVLATHTNGQFSTSATSNERGEFLLGPLPEGEFTLFALGTASQGANSASVRVASGAESVELRLAPGGVLRVRLVSTTGEPVNGSVRVVSPNAGWPQAKQTTRGACELDAVPAGRVTIRATAPTAALSAELEVEVLEGPTPTVVELVMRPKTSSDSR
jgi:hypothetical protein